MNNIDKIVEFNKKYEKELINLNTVRIHVINSLNKIKEIQYKKNGIDKQFILYDINRILNAVGGLFSKDEIKCLRLVYEKDDKNEKE